MADRADGGKKLMLILTPRSAHRRLSNHNPSLFIMLIQDEYVSTYEVHMTTQMTAIT